MLRGDRAAQWRRKEPRGAQAAVGAAQTAVSGAQAAVAAPRPQSRWREAAAAAAMSTEDAVTVSVGLMRQAMAYRVKYRTGKKRIPLNLLGVHTQNRGGVYPQPETVQNLALKLLDGGFSSEEAHHEGVCVQEVPLEHRGPIFAWRAYESYKEFNLRNAQSPILWSCFDEAGDIVYGTLSHSHLLMVLLCFQTGAQWNMPEKWAHLVGPGGKLDFAAVAAADPQLADLCERGLEMEVLSWKMNVEEPMAGSLISQALNKGQQVALHTTELTALAVLTGVVTLELESAVADQVAFESVKEKVRGELDMYVDQAEFIDLFEFVVNMGANKGPYIPELIDFGSKFVDQKQRQLRLNAFAEANKLPLSAPRCKMAMIMRAYRKTPTRAWCPPPEPAWGRALRHRERQRDSEGARQSKRVRERDRDM